MTMSGDVEARKLGEKLLLDVHVEGLSEVRWSRHCFWRLLTLLADTQCSSNAKL